MSKIVFYSTMSSEGHQHYLSILVCAQPHLNENSEYDEYVKATIHPFVSVIVTTIPMFDSALGGQMLRLMYQTSFLPLYQFLTLSPNKHSRTQTRLRDHTSKTEQSLNADRDSILRLEVSISLLFDSFNLLQASESESYKTLYTE